MINKKIFACNFMKWKLKTGQGFLNFYIKKRGLQPLIIPICLSLLLLTFLSGLVIPGRVTKASAALFINEFMADNDNTFEDPDEPGSFEDWIEIYNSGSSTVNMSGMYLTDDLANPTKWRILSGVSIPAKGFRIFWADNDDEEGPTHTSFGLDLKGEEIGLYATDGATLLDSVTFGAQRTDVSYGRYPDGIGNWDFMAGTPGSANSPHNAPPTIISTTHTPVSPVGGEVIWVTCTVTDDSAVASVTLTYIAGSSSAVNIIMHDDGAHNDGGSGDDVFGAQIPAFVKDTIVKYYVIATDSTGDGATDPVTAPSVPYYYIVDYEPPLLYINEFMADNDSTIEDPDEPGSFEDWIEIYNPTGFAVDMGGMYLTDDPNDPTQWKIPPGVSIQAGGYLIFWADNDEEQGPKHASFGLALEGEQIALFGADGVTLVDSITFGPQLLDVSYGRYPDGADNWGFMAGTPSSANSPNNTPPTITGTARNPVLPAGGEVVRVTCTVIDDSAVSNVTLTYVAGGSQAVHITMYDDGAHNDGDSGDDVFGAQIPAFAKDTVVNYYVTVTDNAIGLEFTDPVTAPALTYYYLVDYEPPPLFINEFMADNDSVIEDPHDPNNFEDWIEIYNAGDSTVSMAGMYITDNFANPTKWQIPANVTIPAGGYLLFWADNDIEQGNTHTNFKLKKEAGEIGLFDTNAKKNMPIDTISFSAQPMDFSCGRIYDREEPWVISKDVTPAYTNAFPLGTHSMNWAHSLTKGSHTLMKEKGNCVSAVNRFNTASGKLESAYLFWGKPSGCNFSINPRESYFISMFAPCSLSFE